MKTLVIHPQDPTTEFLSVIYEGKGYTVITDRHIKFIDLLRKVKRYDRIIMMGHGCPYGLLGFTDFFMDARFIKVLRTKDCVCIWCNADKYVEREGIRGFYTGMFISEVGEARYFGFDVDQKTVDYSNMLFVNLMKNMIESPNILNEIKSLYVGDSLVINFNNDRLYYKDNNVKTILNQLVI
jgi:hypothetical protein